MVTPIPASVFVSGPELLALQKDTKVALNMT